MIRALLDTNVLLSGIVGVQRQSSTPGAIVRAWRAQEFELVASNHIIAEVARNLSQHPYFASRLNPTEVAANLASLLTDATQTAITVVVSGVATHPEDDLVLAAAVSAGVDYLVTGDRQLQVLGSYQGVTILDPRSFLVIVGASQSTN